MTADRTQDSSQTAESPKSEGTEATDESTETEGDGEPTKTERTGKTQPSDAEQQRQMAASLADIPHETILNLQDAGYNSLETIAAANRDELLEIESVTYAKASYVQSVAKRQLAADKQEPNEDTIEQETPTADEETNPFVSAEQSGIPDEQMEVTYTPRFAGFIVLFAVLVAAGLVTFSPAALAAGGLLILLLIAGVVQTPPQPQNQLTTAYEVTPKHPRPADTVTVTVTVTNEGAQTFTDLRLVDTVPAELQVVEGVPRRAATLRPGESVTITYSVTARRGEFTFGPMTARTRSLVGSMWVQQPLPITALASMRCAVRADDVPLEEQAAHYIGDLLSDVGGSGIEFYSTREYHRGDPPSRINWRELAKRGELSTITYRERQAADVTIITDARPAARFSGGPGDPSGALLATYATYQLLATLVGRGHYVGVAVPGLAADGADTASPFPCRRIDHGRGDEQQRRAFELFSVVDQLDSLPASKIDGEPFDTVTNTTAEAFARTLTGWADPNTQFVYVSPLLDAESEAFCQQLRNHDVPLVVISPDVTNQQHTADGDGGDDGQINRLARQSVRIQRATRVESLRQQGVTVIDWDPVMPLAVACEQQTAPGE